MDQSIQLLHEALAREPNQAFWCRELQMSRSSLATAKARGRLSPTIATNLARLLGKPDWEHWGCVAGLEADPDSYGKRKMQSLLRDVTNGS